MNLCKKKNTDDAEQTLWFAYDTSHPGKQAVASFLGQHENKIVVLEAVTNVDVSIVRRARHVEEDKARPCHRLDYNGLRAVLVLDAP